MDTIQGGSPAGNQNPESQKFSAPPPPEIGTRTMGSDTSSIQRGDAMPIPETVLPREMEKETIFKPETQVSGDSGATPENNHKSKKTLISIISAVVLVALGAVGYFIIYPKFFNGDAMEKTEVTPPPAQIVEPVLHQSLFISPTQSASELRLNSLLISTIVNSLQALAANKLPNGSIQEVAILDESGSQIPFSSFILAFLPAGDASVQFSKLFEDDFTSFMYYDQKGIWPGYVAKIKPGLTVSLAGPTGLEASEVASRFYLTPPGTFGVFKDGQINGKATRYASASASGAAFNYGVIGNYFIISTSYDGLKNAAPLLGI